MSEDKGPFTYDQAINRLVEIIRMDEYYSNPRPYLEGYQISLQRHTDYKIKALEMMKMMKGCTHFEYVLKGGEVLNVWKLHYTNDIRSAVNGEQLYEITIKPYSAHAITGNTKKGNKTIINKHVLLLNQTR